MKRQRQEQSNQAISNQEQALVALITGSCQGIGAATARLFAEKGYKVMIHGLDKQKVEALMKECEQLSPKKHKMFGSLLDLSDAENGKVLVEETIASFGRLDVLILNAGVWLKTAPNGENMQECWTNFKTTMNVHVMAHVNACIHAVPFLKKAPKKAANIIFTSAPCHVIMPVKDYFAFGVASATQVTLAKALALELAPHIRVNTIALGPVKTPMLTASGYTPDTHSHVTLIEDFLEEHEAAKLYWFLVSDEGRFFDGATLMVDGGLTCNITKFDPDKE